MDLCFLRLHVVLAAPTSVRRANISGGWGGGLSGGVITVVDAGINVGLRLSSDFIPFTFHPIITGRTQLPWHALTILICSHLCT